MSLLAQLWLALAWVLAGMFKAGLFLLQVCSFLFAVGVLVGALITVAAMGSPLKTVAEEWLKAVGTRAKKTLNERRKQAVPLSPLGQALRDNAEVRSN